MKQLSETPAHYFWLGFKNGFGRTVKLFAIVAWLLLALMMLFAPPTHAITALIKQGQTGTGAGTMPATALLTTTASSGQTGQAGLVSTATVTVELPGASAFVTAAGTLLDRGNGYYDYYPAASETAAVGILKVDVTAPNVYEYGTSVQVVGFDPASDLGATALATANTGISTANTGIAGITTTLTTTGVKLSASQAFTNSVAGTVAPTWYTAPPTVAQISAGIMSYALAGTTYQDIIINSASVLFGPFAVTHPTATTQTTQYSFNSLPTVQTNLTTTTAGAPVSKTTTLTNQ